jgi:SulP family sulfate permease
MLVREARRRRKLGGGLYLLGVKERTFDLLRAGGYLDEIGAENVFEDKAAALAHVRRKLDRSICADCDRRIFPECGGAAGPIAADARAR